MWRPRGNLPYWILFLFSHGVHLSGGSEGSFSSRSLHMKVKLGETVQLPCHPRGSDGSVITWSWNGRLVSAGDVKVYNESRIDVLSGGKELRVRQVEREDSGEYSCVLNHKINPVSQLHTIDVLVAPSARIESLSKTLEEREGNRLELRCLVSGYPHPLIRWYRHRDGSLMSENSVLVVERLGPEHSGQYDCRADNSEGEARDTINLNILYRPRTKLERSSGNPYHHQEARGRTSEARKETMFTCVVEANPEPQVKWFKDTQEIHREEYLDLYNSKVVAGVRRENSEKRSHILKIRGLDETDYGNYSCVASNPLGTSTSSFLLTGSPDQPMVVSPALSRYPDRYTLVWRVWSPSAFPILNQSILYRKVRKANGETITDSEGTWHNLALISDTNNIHQEMFSMELSNLNTDTEYEVRLRAMNSQGWSQLSMPFLFKTSGKIFGSVPSMFTEGHLSVAGSAWHVHSHPTFIFVIACFTIMRF